MYSTFSDKKASIVERVQRTIRQRLFRYFTMSGSKKWVQPIQELVESYNNSKHSTTGYKPNDVKHENVQDILNKMYSSPHYKKLVKQHKYKRRLLKVGDNVRIVKSRTIFTKEAEQKWTMEIFKIRKVQRHHFPITYLLTDQKGENILGSFYLEELEKV